MKKADKLFQDCVRFWEECGIAREDNIIAMAALDVVNAKVDGWEMYNVSHYIERARAICRELSDKKYDSGRGKSGWLVGKGL